MFTCLFCVCCRFGLFGCGSCIWFEFSCFVGIMIVFCDLIDVCLLKVNLFCWDYFVCLVVLIVCISFDCAIVVVFLWRLIVITGMLCLLICLDGLVFWVIYLFLVCYLGLFWLIWFGALLWFLLFGFYLFGFVWVYLFTLLHCLVAFECWLGLICYLVLDFLCLLTGFIGLSFVFWLWFVYYVFGISSSR